MTTFKKFVENKNQINRLCIYDFDDTIAAVPEKPQSNEPQHDWNGKDWWGSEHSLREPFYDGSVHAEVINSMKADIKDPITDVIVLTGRRGITAHMVRAVLRNNGLVGARIIPDSNVEEKTKFMDLISQGKEEENPSNPGHEEYYSGDFRKENGYGTRVNSKGKVVPNHTTLAHKEFVIKQKFDQHNPDIIEIWDDREDHIAIFEQYGKELLAKKSVSRFTIHRVYPEKGGNKFQIVHYNL